MLLSLTSLGLAGPFGLLLLGVVGIVCAAPGVTASIASALRACIPCPLAPPTRRWINVDRMNIARAFPGASPQVNLLGIPLRDELGRVAHLRGFYFDAIGVFTLAGANAAVAAYQLRSLFTNINLQDFTQKWYLPNIDFRTLLDATWMRHWAQIADWPYMTAGVQGQLPNYPFAPTKTFNTQIPLNNGQGAFRARVGGWFPFTNQNPGFSPLHGLIPVSSLIQQSGQGAFRFDILNAIRGDAASILGITFTGLENSQGVAGMDVWADVIYLPAVVSSPWGVDNFTLPQNTNTMPHADAATEALMIRFFPEDAAANAGQVLVANLDNFSLITGASQTELLANMNLRQNMITRQMLFYMTETMGALARANAKQDLPLQGDYSDPTTLAGLVLLPYRQIGNGEAGGQIVVGYGTNPNTAPTRFTQIYMECKSEEWHALQIAAAECQPCGQPTPIQVSPRTQGDVPQTSKRGTLVTAVNLKR